MKMQIINNKRAVIGMPVYLLVAIVVAGVIIGLFAIAIYNSIKNSQTEQVKNEIEKIISEAEKTFPGEVVLAEDLMEIEFNK